MVTLQWLAFSEGDWPHGRSDQCIRTGSQDATRSDSSKGVTTTVCWRVETEIYGLVSGPSWLRASLTVDLLAAGYLKNPYDKCLFTLFSSDETSEGQLLLDVDDFIEGGNEIHRKTIEGFYDKYRFGKAIGPQVGRTRGTRFAGRRVVQHPDFAHCVDGRIVKSKLRPIEVPKGYFSNTKEISDGMLTNVKGVNGGLGWAGVNGKTRHGGASSIMPSGYDRRSPQLISDVNAAVKPCHAVPITITIWSIPFAELRWTTFTDSSSTQGSDSGTNKVGWCVPPTSISIKNGRRQ